jgi:hypothetical protein
MANAQQRGSADQADTEAVYVLASGTVPIGFAVLHGGDYRNALQLREVAADQVKGTTGTKGLPGKVALLHTHLPEKAFAACYEIDLSESTCSR